MTTCTPIYQIPVVEGADDPCDIGDTLCAIAEATEVQLNLLDAVVARTDTTIPMVWVRTTTPFSIIETSGSEETPAPFDTVVVNTDNMVNLTADTNTVVINTSGLYAVWMYMEGTATAAGPNALLQEDLTFSLAIAADNNMEPRIVFVDGAVNQLQQSSALGVMRFTAGDSLSMNVNINGFTNDVVRIDTVELGLAWLSDLP